MANSQNYIDIYYAVGNANTKRQENEIASIMKVPKADIKVKIESNNKKNIFLHQISE